MNPELFNLLTRIDRLLSDVDNYGIRSWMGSEWSSELDRTLLDVDNLLQEKVAND